MGATALVTHCVEQEIVSPMATELYQTQQIVDNLRTQLAKEKASLHEALHELMLAGRPNNDDRTEQLLETQQDIATAARDSADALERANELEENRQSQEELQTLQRQNERNWQELTSHYR